MIEKVILHLNVKNLLNKICILERRKIIWEMDEGMRLECKKWFIMRTHQSFKVDLATTNYY